MSPDLQTLLRDAAPKPLHDVDPREIARRSARIKLTRSFAAVTVAALFLGGGTVVAQALGDRPGPAVAPDDERGPRPADRGQGRDAPPGPEKCERGCRDGGDHELRAEIAEYEAEPVDLAAKAATFANAVVGRAGLLDGFGERWSYRGVAPRSDGFVLTFRARECPSHPYSTDDRRCERRYEAKSLRVRVDGDLFVLEGMSRAGLPPTRRIYREEEIPQDRHGWRLTGWSFARGSRAGRRGVSFALTWTGNLPAPGGTYGSTCWMNVYARSGELVVRGPLTRFRPGAGEASRVQVFSTEVTTSGKPDHVGVGCRPPAIDEAYETE